MQGKNKSRCYRSRQTVSLFANISICNSYGPNLRSDVTDLDKRSVPPTNVSICNSYRPYRPVYVTDQDKPIPRSTASQSVTLADRNLLSKLTQSWSNRGLQEACCSLSRLDIWRQTHRALRRRSANQRSSGPAVSCHFLCSSPYRNPPHQTSRHS